MIDRDRLRLRAFYFISQDKLKEIRTLATQHAFRPNFFELIERDGTHWIQTGPYLDAVVWEIFEHGFTSSKLKT